MLRYKTFSSIVWSSLDNLSKNLIRFIVGIFLARLLSPKEYGIVGIALIFVTFSEIFINGGFYTALIRKQKCSELDYSTIFYYNLSVGVFLFIIFNLLTVKIANFFQMVELKTIIRVISFILLIDSLSIIHRTILTKELRFKLLTKISLISGFISGIISIILAYLGFGVWSLVVNHLLNHFFQTLFLILFLKWKPLFRFSKESFLELFSFGSKIFINSLIDNIFRNLYYVIIGKFFDAGKLGNYSRAEQFSAFPSSNLAGVVGRVSEPILASIQDEEQRLFEAYKKFLSATVVISSFMLIWLAITSEPLILFLLGEKWKDSILYLKLLSIYYVFYPIAFLQQSLIEIKGRSDIVLYLGIWKKLLAVPTIFIGIFYGITYMIFSMIGAAFLNFLVDSYFCGRLIKYQFLKQIKETLRPLFLILIIGIITVIINDLVKLGYLNQILLISSFYFFIFFFINECFKFPEYIFLRNILKDQGYKVVFKH